MKKSLLVGLGIAVLALTGCGQDVEKINAKYIDMTNTSASQEVEFTGYYARLDKGHHEDVKEYTRENKLPSSVSIDSDGSLTKFPDTDFSSDATEDAEGYYKKLAAIKKGVESKASEKIEEVTADLKQKEVGLQQEIASVTARKAEYEALVKPENDAYNAINDKINEQEQVKKDTQKEFDGKLKSAIISESIAIDANKHFDLGRQYRSKYGKNYCVNNDDDHVRELSMPERCIKLRSNNSNAMIRNILLTYSAMYEEARIKIEALRKELSVAKKAYNKASIIAKNKTNYNSITVERELKSLERKLERIPLEIKLETNEQTLIVRGFRDHPEVSELMKSYQTSARQHNKDVEFAAFQKAGIDVDTFSDENDVIENDEEEGVAVAFVFNKGEDQDVYIGVSGDSSTSFAEIFEGRVRKVNSQMRLDDEDGFLRLLSEKM